MNPRCVVILGAARSGKSWLFEALGTALKTRGHWLVSEGDRPASWSSAETDTLVMGLDLPGILRVQMTEDMQLRQSLAASHTPFRVVYGQGSDRLRNALMALGLPPEGDASWPDRESTQFNINRGRDVWTCNDCSDPACEHRLFTRLLSRRSS